MHVRDAIASRYSCRSFLPTPIAEESVREIVERAARAPSAGARSNASRKATCISPVKALSLSGRLSVTSA